MQHSIINYSHDVMILYFIYFFLIFILFLNFAILYFKFQGLIYFMPNFLFGISEGEVQLSAF